MNLPDSLTPPPDAVAPTVPLKVKTNTWIGPNNSKRDAGEFDLLAVGWYPTTTPEPFAYLVYDRIHHEVFWVAQSLVEGLWPA